MVKRKKNIEELSYDAPTKVQSWIHPADISNIQQKQNGEVYEFEVNTDRSQREGKVDMGLLASTKKIGQSLKGFISLTDNINIIQVYPPTTASTEEGLDTFYNDLITALKNTKTEAVNLILGDLNAKVGKRRDAELIGEHGLGTHNKKRDRSYSQVTAALGVAVQNEPTTTPVLIAPSHDETGAAFRLKVDASGHDTNNHASSQQSLLEIHNVTLPTDLLVAKKR
ncbi:hypothetical protein ILUMI_26376 [Ignelater luminosus]|uniref:Endonuclease/exonuclease/phosphatase domain-containing protein n=1 Tax=Ignelater luminosus TaxID=2038154 RepID=A0A8K0C6T8_IGNLU|nr:hypothetical protein ILUMI_26376 [Ignelater luminosus]